MSECTCAAELDAALKRAEEWKAKWPNHCPECCGTGGDVSAYDPSPSGVALSPGYMYDFDPCEACMETCPRCGQPMDKENDAPCPSCGWNWGKNPDDASPPPPDGPCAHCEAEYARQEEETFNRPYFTDDDPECVCGVVRSEHALCGCERFERRVK